MLCRGLFTPGVALALIVLLAGRSQAQVHVCGPNEYPVSVEHDATIYCVASRPCSGDYDKLSREGSVGACPMHAGCALLPQTPNVMGCMKANLPDVAYVNPDGSLTRNGVKVPTAPTNGANANANANENPSAAQFAKPGMPGGLPGDANGIINDNANANANNANANTDGNANAKGNANANANPNANANANGNAAANANAAAAANATSAVPSETPKASEPVATTAPPTSSDGSAKSSVSKTSVATNQQSMGDINNDPMSKAKNGPTQTSGLGSTVAIVVGCLACVAIVAGVFVLRKNKQEAGAEEDGGEMVTPMEPGVNGYGGMTPKDQVQLL